MTLFYIYKISDIECLKKKDIRVPLISNKWDMCLWEVSRFIRDIKNCKRKLHKMIFLSSTHNTFIQVLNKICWFMLKSLLGYINCFNSIIFWNLDKLLYSLNKCPYLFILLCFWLHWIIFVLINKLKFSMIELLKVKYWDVMLKPNLHMDQIYKALWLLPFMILKKNNLLLTVLESKQLNGG